MRHQLSTRFGTALVSAAVGAVCGGFLGSLGGFLVTSTIMDETLILGAALVGACCTVR